MSDNLFEQIKHIDKNGSEFWYAREFARVLGYEKFSNFENVIQKAKIALHNSGYDSQDHLPDVGFQDAGYMGLYERENIFGESKANETHKKAGQEVREAIKRLGGQIPENLPRKENIKTVKGRVKKLMPKVKKSTNLSENNINK